MWYRGNDRETEIMCEQTTTWCDIVAGVVRRVSGLLARRGDFTCFCNKLNRTEMY